MSKEPFFGFIPRRVTVEQAQRVLVCPHVLFIHYFSLTFNFQNGDVNPFTKQPHSAQYRKILEARKKLPVYAQMEEFFKMVSPSTSNVD